MHGGIGNTLNYIDKLENLAKPIEVNYKPINYNQQIVLDLLWSDPVSNEQMENQENSQRDTFHQGNVIKYGLARIKRFLADNNLLYIIRSHETLLDGIEHMGGFVKSIFSTTDYCGKFNNVAAIGILKKNYDLVTKSLAPLASYPKEKLWFVPESLDEHIGGKPSKCKAISDQVDLQVRRKKATPPRPRLN